ncbi:MAG: PL29 family lyase N-terminal domain-containing protein [Bacteroidales bacterium]|nr:PL29 family lyase N-terminal domain-containing protein [Bacteroidales bacterium]
MKKGIIAALFAAAIAVVGCYNDDELQKKVNDLDKRVTTLEEQVKELNEKTVPGLQATVAAIQDGVFVSKVSKTAEGVTITFSDGTSAFIKDGAKGDKGDSPVIAVKEIDGVFYWTINGEVVEDAEGNPITVYEALPEFRINNGKWEVSYDEGKTWTIVDVMGEAEALPISIQDDADTVTFYIGEESYVIQKEHAFFISFNISDRKNIGVPEGEEFMYEYTINGLREDDELEVDILNVTAGWEAKVVSLPKGETPGYIAVKNLENKDGKVFVYAANGKGKTDIKSLVFEGGVLTADMDVKTVGAEGGNLILTVVTNMDYELYIPKNQKWLTQAPETKATHTDVITLVAAPNETGAYRSTEVDVILQNMETKAFVILQEQSASVATDIASLANVEEGTEVTLFNEVVVAAAAEGFVISDGKKNLYIADQTAAKGDLVEISGTVTEDGFVASSVEIKGNDHALPAETRFYYFAYSQIYDCVFTAVNGILNIDGETYSIEMPYGDVITLATPSSVEGLVAGNVVSAKGYMIGYEEGDEADEYTMLAAEIASAPFTKKGEMTYNPDGSNSSYPDEIDWPGFTEGYAQYSIYKKEAIGEMSEAEFAYNISMQAADDYQYDYLHSYGASMAPATLAPLVLYAPGETCAAKLPYGEYIVVATGMDEYGRLSGDYGFLEIIKEEPVSNAAYEDYLGTWKMGTDLLTISQKEAGKTYNISGIKGQKNDNYGYNVEAVVAEFVNGNIVLKEQATSATAEVGTNGLCNIYLSGVFAYSGKTYGYYPINGDEPQVIFSGALVDDKIVLTAGSCEYGSFTSMGFSWVIAEGTNAGKGNTFTGTTLGNMEKPGEAKEAYKKWLGNYTFVIGGETYNATIQQLNANTDMIVSFDDEYIEDYEAVATWDEAKDVLTISGQKLGTWTHSTYGTITDTVCGIIEYNGNKTSVTGSYDIATLSYNDGNITVDTAGKVTLSVGDFDIIGMSMFGVTSDNKVLRYVDVEDYQMFPYELTKAAGTTATSSKSAGKTPVIAGKAVAEKAVAQPAKLTSAKTQSTFNKKVSVKAEVKSVRNIK